MFAFQRRRFLAPLLLLALLVAGQAQEGPGPTTQRQFAPLRVEDSSLLDGPTLLHTTEQIGSQELAPDHLMVLIHGYEMGAHESSALFENLAARVRSELSPSRVAVVGVQWDSYGTAFLNPAADYYGRLSAARQIGRGPVRQVLLSLQESYPGVPISVLAHSMGCEIAVAAVAPEMVYRSHSPDGETFEPSREVRLAFAGFVGSDLDYDVWHKAGQAGEPWFERCGLTWSTLTDPVSQGDRVLSMRARLRGKAAGSLLPRLTVEQLDSVIPRGRLYLDGHQVPSNHALDAYFDGARVSRMMAALRFAAGPTTSQEPEELKAMRQAVEAPEHPSALLPMLDSPYAGAAFAALWRVERMNCGDARHMADGTLERAVLMLADSPKLIWREQHGSDCVTMRRGQFPTPRTMARAGAPERARPAKWRLESPAPVAPQ